MTEQIFNLSADSVTGQANRNPENELQVNVN